MILTNPNRKGCCGRTSETLSKPGLLLHYANERKMFYCTVLSQHVLPSGLSKSCLTWKFYYDTINVYNYIPIYNFIIGQVLGERRENLTLKPLFCFWEHFKSTSNLLLGTKGKFLLYSATVGKKTAQSNPSEEIGLPISVALAIPCWRGLPQQPPSALPPPSFSGDAQQFLN
jgi:hypothetical protein